MGRRSSHVNLTVSTRIEVEITQPYTIFETGHTEMKRDSMHLNIERKHKNGQVYVPEGWAKIIRASRIAPHLFVVRTLIRYYFLDFDLNNCCE